ncbi:MAG: DUF5110 domain-containing protein [Alphaproteobacteria bacterium]|nr:DUF5110 domain-containing protein [Alphaproteobacteria bacterium]
MRKKRLMLVLAMLLALVAAPVRAEITWLADLVLYELSGADLFRLRAEMPTRLQDALRPLRNVTYSSEAAFRDAFEAAVTDPALRATWWERLVGFAAAPGVSIGAEPRGTGMLTLHIAGSADRFDPTPFTARTWLAALPPPRDGPSGGVNATMVGTCLEIATPEGEDLFALCDAEAGETGTSVALMSDASAVYGLGQQFGNEGEARANRIGSKREGLNAMTGFNGGANGNTLIPIAYFDRDGTRFALFLDNRYPQVWDFSMEPWRLTVKGGDLRLHVLTGDSLAELRRKYMMLSGTPPVPPKAMFGLWLSEYGFDTWAELDDKLGSLDQNGFPVAGIVLDLQWFGGVGNSGGPSRMGSLEFDTRAFPEPKKKIAELAARGIGTMLIEEPYVDKSLPEFADLAERGFLARDAEGEALLTGPARQWWGHGGMIDWATPEAGAYWHDLKRQKLVDMGVVAHWTDLGEPEMFNPDNRYGDGLTEEQVHNSYNLLWLESIADGYRRNAPDRRVFMMSRSGAAGMQRLGAAMWSGDTGADFWSLIGQMPQQTHMMWSGIDYYGSDVGGFRRSALSHFDGAPSRDAAMDALYTQWLAYAALYEVPIRPHTENLCNCRETAPDRIGDLVSNRASLELRRRLLPYYYALAHKAWRDGEPVFPSLDYLYPEDGATVGISTTKMIGRDLVGAAVAAYGAKAAKVYLPRGKWYDFRDGTMLVSNGGYAELPLWRDGVFALPLLARDGAVVPVDTGGGTHALTVFGEGDGQFDWYDDDGETLAYQDGDFDLIRIGKSGLTLTLTRARGDALAPMTLSWHLPDGVLPRAALIDGEPTTFGLVGPDVRIDLPDFADRLTIELRP